MCTFGTIISTIVNLQKRIRGQSREYFNIVNIIREGVLILKEIDEDTEESTMQVSFVNESAAKILKSDINFLD